MRKMIQDSRLWIEDEKNDSKLWIQDFPER